MTIENNNELVEITGETMELANKNTELNGRVQKSLKSRYKDFLKGMPLELNENEGIKANSTKNVKLILTSDPKLKGVFGWNDFTNQFIVLKDVPDLIIKKRRV